MPVPEPSTGCIAQPNNANLNPMSTETHIRRIFASGTSSLATIDVQMANVTAVELVNAWIPSGEYIIDTSNNIIDILYGPASTFGQQDRRMLNTSGTIYERAFAGISDTSDPHETPYRKTITVEPGNYSTSEYITRMAVNNDTIGGRIKVEIKTQQQKVTFSFSNPFTLVFPIDSTAGRLFGLHSVVQHNKTKQQRIAKQPAETTASRNNNVFSLDEHILIEIKRNTGNTTSGTATLLKGSNNNKVQTPWGFFKKGDLITVDDGVIFTIIDNVDVVSTTMTIQTSGTIIPKLYVKFQRTRTNQIVNRGSYDNVVHVDAVEDVNTKDLTRKWIIVAPDRADLSGARYISIESKELANQHGGNGVLAQLGLRRGEDISIYDPGHMIPPRSFVSPLYLPRLTLSFIVPNDQRLYNFNGLEWNITIAIYTSRRSIPWAPIISDI
jgi:hypothetical protein